MGLWKTIPGGSAMVKPIVREKKVVRQRIDDYDVEAGCADMLADFHEAHFQEVHREELPEPTAKQYYDMLSAAHKPLHRLSSKVVAFGSEISSPNS